VTDPVFGLYSIPIHTAMASMPISNDLIEDSAFDIAGISSDFMAESFVLGENDAFINGSGIGRPMGILSQVDGDGPDSVKSGTAATLLSNGIIDLAYKLPAQYESNAAFIMAKQTEKVIRQLKTTDGLYIWPLNSPMGGFAPAPKELLGFQTLRDEFMPAIAANAYPIIFGDLRGYLVLDRVGISVQRLSEIYAETNITLLLARKRLGGQTIEPWRLKIQKCAA
jgi:HK97 family phage major capsid protein